VISVHRELPDLEFLGCDALVLRLNDLDLIEEPVRPRLIGDVFGAVVEEYVPVPIPPNVNADSRPS